MRPKSRGNARHSAPTPARCPPARSVRDGESNLALATPRNPHIPSPPSTFPPPHSSTLPPTPFPPNPFPLSPALAALL